MGHIRDKIPVHGCSSMSNRSLGLLTALLLFVLQPAGAADDPCSAAVPVDLSFLRTGTTLFGELHGNAESPAVFLAAVCDAVSQRGAVVHVALELPVQIQPHLDRYFSSKDSTKAREAFLAQPFWHRRTAGQDGRSSTAMWELVQQLRQVDQAYESFQGVVAVAGRRQEAAEAYQALNHSAYLAGNIAEIAAELDSGRDYVLALVGNFHASRQAPGGLEHMKPAAAYLGAEASTVLLLPTGGESWSCSEGCGTRAVYEPENPDKFVRASQREGGFDHVVVIGPVTSSPPLFLLRDTP